MTKQEKLFDSNWKAYIEDALTLYITSEGWNIISPKKMAKQDYIKFKKQMRHVIKAEGLR